MDFCKKWKTEEIFYCFWSLQFFHILLDDLKIKFKNLNSFKADVGYADSQIVLFAELFGNLFNCYAILAGILFLILTATGRLNDLLSFCFVRNFTIKLLFLFVSQLGLLNFWLWLLIWQLLRFLFSSLAKKANNNCK